MTDISQDKITAYLSTDYIIGEGSASFVMKIGNFSRDVHALYQCQGVNCCLFITAYNPFGMKVTEAENEHLYVELGKELRRISPLVIEGEGSDPTGNWDPEKSFLAYGVDEQTSRQLGAKYRQDAVVWVGHDAVPLLLLLR